MSAGPRVAWIDEDAPLLDAPALLESTITGEDLALGVAPDGTGKHEGWCDTDRQRPGQHQHQVAQDEPDTRGAGSC